MKNTLYKAIKISEMCAVLSIINTGTKKWKRNHTYHMHITT